jgi:hypothetical protein
MANAREKPRSVAVAHATRLSMAPAICRPPPNRQQTCVSDLTSFPEGHFASPGSTSARASSDRERMPKVKNAANATICLDVLSHGRDRLTFDTLFRRIGVTKQSCTISLAVLCNGWHGREVDGELRSKRFADRDAAALWLVKLAGG